MREQHDEVRAEVRKRYGRIAQGGGGYYGCGCGQAPTRSETLGYAADALEALPEGADLGLGCGNPHAIAALRPGEVVLDLGSGGGIDCFLAAKQVGPTGKVIGVDMTPRDGREGARERPEDRRRHRRVPARRDEHLPVADATVDVILSNCVINLSPDKAACSARRSGCCVRAAGSPSPIVIEARKPGGVVSRRCCGSRCCAAPRGERPGARAPVARPRGGYCG